VKRYKVWPVPGSSDTNDETHFAVAGPDVAIFPRMKELAATMQRALNAAERPPPRKRLTPVERAAIVDALGFVLAGEDPWASEGDDMSATWRACQTAYRKL
jgi:hypothetical protein